MVHGGTDNPTLSSDYYSIGSGVGLVGVGQKITGSAYASGTGTLSLYTMYVSSGSSSYEILDYNKEDITLNSNLQRITSTYTTTSSGRNKVAGVRLALSSSSGNTLYADNIKLEYGASATPYDSDFIGDHVTPRKLMRVGSGFRESSSSASGTTILQFTGLTENLQPNLRDDNISIHSIDFSTDLKNINADPAMYEDAKTSDLIKILANQGGLDSSQWSIEEGNHVVSFAWFQEGSIWYYMQMVAEAEGGRVFFDNSGVLHFWNKNHLIDNLTIAKTFSFSDILNMEYKIDADKMKNRIICRTKPREVEQYQRVWTLDNRRTIAPGAEEVVFADIQDNFNRDMPCTRIDKPVANIAGTSHYHATDGTDKGNDMTGSLGITSWYAFAKEARMIFKNNSSQDIQLNEIELWGTPAKVIDDITVTIEDNESVSLYGRQELNIENDMIDTEAFAESLAMYRLEELKDPTKFVTIEVMGDPTLEVGDIICCQLDYDSNYDVFKIVRIRWTLSDDYKQTLNLEKLVVDTATNVNLDPPLVIIDKWFRLDKSSLDEADILTY